jgi:hypothetical protein
MDDKGYEERRNLKNSILGNNFYKLILKTVKIMICPIYGTQWARLKKKLQKLTILNS